MSKLYCSQGTWEGVKVNGISGQGHYLSPPDNTVFNDFNAYRGVINPVHGYVELWTGTKIKKARHGLWSLDGGIVQSWIVPTQATAKFIDCREGIYIEDCQQNPSAIRLNKCDLTWTSPAIWGELDYSNPEFKHITVDNSKDAYFGGCLLSGEDCFTSGNIYDFDDKGVGFVMFGAESSATFGEAGNAFYSDPDYCKPVVRYLSSPTVNHYGKVTVLSLGLVSSGYELGVNHVNFWDNMVSIGEISGYTFATDFVDLHDNSFRTNDRILKFHFISTGVTQKTMVSINVQEATIYKNEFWELNGYSVGNKFTFVYPYPSSGLLFISAAPGANDIKVYENEFDGWGWDDINFSPFGLGGTGDLSNLEWKCNVFNNLDRAVSL